MKYPSSQKWRVTSTFKDHLEDRRRAGIPGTDYASLPHLGDKILSPEDGKLSFWRDQYQGLWAVVTTAKGHRWDFGHCKGIIGLHKAGTSRDVKAGDPIAIVGHSGFTIPEGKGGTHVHVSFRTDSGPKGGGNYVDPQPILEDLWRGELEMDKIEAQASEIQGKSEQLAKKEAEIVQMQGEIEKLSKEVYELKIQADIAIQPDIISSSYDILSINEKIMKDNETIAKEVGGAYMKFIAPSTAIATGLVVVLNNGQWGPDEATVVGAALVQVVNIALILINRFIKLR